MDDSYFEDLVDAIKESRALMVVPEERAMTPHHVEQGHQTAQIFQESPPNVFDAGHAGDITPDRQSVDFERDLVCIEYTESRHEHRDMKEGNIEFAALFEAMLPERERTPQFKCRLFKYMLGILVITVIMDIATAGHATIFALLNSM